MLHYVTIKTCTILLYKKLIQEDPVIYIIGNIYFGTIIALMLL
jgi:hypothetical protein